MIPVTLELNSYILHQLLKSIKSKGMVMYWRAIRKRKQNLLDIIQLVTAFLT
jgi:hypothetical protein